LKRYGTAFRSPTYNYGVLLSTPLKNCKPKNGGRNKQTNGHTNLLNSTIPLANQ
jgi:hypothetical protein